MRIKREFARGAARKMWHPFYAVWPRAVGSHWVFFEWIERKGTFHVAEAGLRTRSQHWWTWEYRNIPHKLEPR